MIWCIITWLSDDISVNDVINNTLQLAEREYAAALFEFKKLNFAKDSNESKKTIRSKYIFKFQTFNICHVLNRRRVWQFIQNFATQYFLENIIVSINNLYKFLSNI